MKFLESTNFFVRTIMFDFVNKDKKTQLKFRLVPVIHIGSESFYDTVFKVLDECNEVFYEGADLKEFKFLGKHYKRIAERLGLVSQHESLKLKELNAKLTHADFSKKQGKEEYQKLRLLEKIKIKYFFPIRCYLENMELSREILAKQYMTYYQELYLAYGPREDEKGTIRNLVMNAREQIVFEKIKNKIELESDKNKTIGIIYGAGHMKSIARYLIDKHHYIPIKGEFMKVFNIN